MKMTASWTDYLLCQLSSSKQLATLECLPPEILDPILEEVSSTQEHFRHLEIMIKAPFQLY